MSRRQGLRSLNISLLLAMLAGCASSPQYLYLPADKSGQASDQSQKEKSYYRIPPDAPTGSVRISSGGLVKLKPNEGGSKFTALHLRMVISNESGADAWSVNPQEQKISLPNISGLMAPVFTQAESSAQPNLLANRGETKIIELYYRLPEQAQSEDKISEFNFVWQVMVGTRSVAMTTVFDRVPIHTYAVMPNPYFYPNYLYPSYFYPGYYSSFGWGMQWSMAPFVVVPARPVAPPSRPVIVGH